jgi:gluconate 2-dehydrogenase gamma chain
MLQRRDFLINSVLLLSFPAAALKAKEYASEHIMLYAEPYQTAAAVYAELWRGTDAPSLEQINAVGYLHGVMHDPYVEKREKRFIINGAAWLNEESRQRYQKTFTALGQKERKTLLENISATRWGDNWLYALMGYLFEAMLSDPIYGGNKLESGWKWLEHEPGYPRPKKVLL